MVPTSRRGVCACSNSNSASDLLQSTTQEEAAVVADSSAASTRRRRNPAATSDTRTYKYIRTRGWKRVDYAPGTRVGQKTEVLIARQLRDLMQNPVPGISVAPDENNVFLWHVVMVGPENTPYAGGLFKVDLRFTKNFPGTQPRVQFRTKIWHPNIGDEYSAGITCVDWGQSATLSDDSDSDDLDDLDDLDDFDIVYQRDIHGARDVRSAACVLVGLQMLLSTPNPRDPYNHIAGAQMREEPMAFDEQAREWTKKYAV